MLFTSMDRPGEVETGGHETPPGERILDRLIAAAAAMLCLFVTAAWGVLLVWGATELISGSSLHRAKASGHRLIQVNAPLR